MRFRRATVVIAAALALVWMVDSVRPTQAMPPFAQAYGMHCEACHSVVPALNAYGRYVQRTGYASLDPGTIHRANPIWIGESPFYDTQDPAEPHAIQWGNLAIHAAGYFGNDWTFHLHQWVYQSDLPGGTDTVWVTYNNLFHRDGHLFFGEIEAPAPSPFSQWFDLNGFAPPSFTVGEHTLPFADNRWGTKFAYVKKWFTGEVAYLGPSGDLNVATNFNPAETDRTFQWRLVDSLGYKPFEFGIYGGTGVAPVSNGFDRYNATAVYAQLDAQHGLPGALAIYQRGHDANPGTDFGPANSKAFSVEVYQPFLSNNAMLGLRDEYTNDGLGTGTHSGNIDLAFLAEHTVTERQAQGLIVNLEALLAQGATPGWRGQVWFVTTIGALKK
ncbi:MAG: hypothetical protein DLM53_11615 [Candidatus Eremiobacter antarcticus]|nr:hypothetical protein [Candidatus Eremiobacteraeota bacterium]MBC5809015.1 hypothetical protein [Candidatus Eremiobacteraeota bacterium]PZR60311.1 MAG: hypothetical protein DLM53_11615 [Candidatus Eremiobacter sp. RRmetagenome_bin22]